MVLIPNKLMPWQIARATKAAIFPVVICLTWWGHYFAMVENWPWREFEVKK